MSKCNFSIQFSGSASDIISKARQTIENAGGTFNGDVLAGSLSISSFIGKIEGQYAIVGNEMNVVISEKPLFITCGRIEDELKKYMSKENPGA